MRRPVPDTRPQHFTLNWSARASRQNRAFHNGLDRLTIGLVLFAATSIGISVWQGLAL